MVVQDAQRVLATAWAQAAVAPQRPELGHGDLIEPHDAPKRPGGELLRRGASQVGGQQADGQNDNPAQQQPAAAVPGGDNTRAPHLTLGGKPGRRSGHQILATKSDSPGMSRRWPLTPLTMHMMRKTTKMSQMTGARIMITQPTPGIMLSTK